MAIDLNYFMAVFMPFYMIIIIAQIFNDVNAKNNSGANNHFNFDFVPLVIFSGMTFFLLNKDFYDARSVAKRIFGYQVFDIQTNMPANSTKCMIRNITFIIWPVEAIIVLFNPQRRLGDFIAGTKVLDKETEDPESILANMVEQVNYEESRRTVLLSIVFTALLAVLALFPAELINYVTR